jgi:hypothetical protein
MWFTKCVLRNLQVVCDGKVSLADLTSRLQEDDGLPVTGMKAKMVYATRRAVEAEHHTVYKEKLLCLPRYLHDVAEKNPGS